MSSTLTNIQQGTSVATLDGLSVINADQLTVNGQPVTSSPTTIGILATSSSGINAIIFTPSFGTTTTGTLLVDGTFGLGYQPSTDTLFTKNISLTGDIIASGILSGTPSYTLGIDSTTNKVVKTTPGIASQVTLTQITSGIYGNYYFPFLRYDVSGNQVLYVDTQFGTMYYSVGSQTLNAINLTANNAVSGLSGSFGTVTTSSSITATGPVTSSSFVSSGTSNLQNATISALTVSSSATLPQFITFSTAPSSGTASSFLALNSLNQVVTASGISAQPTVTATSTNATFYPIFAPNSTTTSSSPIYVDTAGSLNYNPNTKVLYSSNFYGSNVTTASATLVNSSGSLTELINTVAGTYYTGTLVGDIIFQSSKGAWWGVASGNTFNILVNSVNMLSASSTGVALTGTPTAPTAGVGTNNNQIATTAFCSNGFLPITGSIGGVNANYGVSTAFNITNSTYTLTVFSATPTGVALLGTVTAPTATAGDNSTKVATTAFVTSAIPSLTGYLQKTGGTMTGAITIDASDLTFIQMTNSKTVSYTYNITDTGTNGTTTWFQFRTPASLASPAVTALLTLAQPTTLSQTLTVTGTTTLNGGLSVYSGGTFYAQFGATNSVNGNINFYDSTGVNGVMQVSWASGVNQNILSSASYNWQTTTGSTGTTAMNLSSTALNVSVQALLLSSVTNPNVSLNNNNYFGKATTAGSFINDASVGDLCINSRTGNIRFAGGSQYTTTGLVVNSTGIAVDYAYALNTGYTSFYPANNGSGNYPPASLRGTGSMSIGWNLTGGQAEMDFINNFDGTGNGNSAGFNFYNLTGATTTRQLTTMNAYSFGIQLNSMFNFSSAGTWDNNNAFYITVGGMGGTNPGVGMGYSTSDATGYLVSIQPNVQWLPMTYKALYHVFNIAGNSPTLYVQDKIYGPAFGSTGVGLVIGNKPSASAIQMTYSGGTQGYLTIGATSSQYTVYQPNPTSGIYGFSYNWGGTGFGFPSDRRLKDHIEPIANCKENFMKLNPCQYHYKSDEEQKKRFGFIAQELQEVYPDAVYTSEITEKDEDGTEFKPLLLTQTYLIPMMVDQIQTLHKTVDNQAETIQMMAQHITNLTNQVNELTKQMQKI